MTSDSEEYSLAMDFIKSIIGELKLSLFNLKFEQKISQLGY